MFDFNYKTASSVVRTNPLLFIATLYGSIAPSVIARMSISYQLHQTLNINLGTVRMFSYTALAMLFFIISAASFKLATAMQRWPRYLFVAAQIAFTTLCLPYVTAFLLRS